jgi:hypothetical protein
MTEYDTQPAVAALHVFHAIHKVGLVHGAPARHVLVTFLDSLPSQAHISWRDNLGSIDAKVLSSLISDSLDDEDGIS